MQGEQPPLVAFLALGLVEQERSQGWTEGSQGACDLWNQGPIHGTGDWAILAPLHPVAEEDALVFLVKPCFVHRPDSLGVVAGEVIGFEKEKRKTQFFPKSSLKYEMQWQKIWVGNKQFHIIVVFS